MGFAENLKQIRKEKNYSQEELAELLEVSRQAVGKWEQGFGYPEVDKLLILSKKLNVSLDRLMAENIAGNNSEVAGNAKILIPSADGKTMVDCYKVLMSQKIKTKYDESRYALLGIEGYSFWGENATLLGWYDEEKQIQREVQEIMTALVTGEKCYNLKYSIKEQHIAFPERIGRKVVYESDWVSLYLDKVKMSSGYIIDAYHKLHYPHESVCVVIVNEKEEILMIQSKRYVTERLEWEIPAGRIEQNETPKEAARRECLAEAGCTIRDLKFLCCENPSNGMSDLKIHVFGAKVDTETMNIDENEVNAKCWIPKERVIEILRENETYCGVSMLGLLYAFEFYI